MSDLKEKLFQGIGAASMCWEPLPGNQAFDSTRAKEIGDSIWADIEKLQERIKVLEAVMDAAEAWATECRDDLGHDKMNLTWLVQALQAAKGMWDES